MSSQSLHLPVQIASILQLAREAHRSLRPFLQTESNHGPAGKSAQPVGALGLDRDVAKELALDVLLLVGNLHGLSLLVENYLDESVVANAEASDVGNLSRLWECDSLLKRICQDTKGKHLCNGTNGDSPAIQSGELHARLLKLRVQFHIALSADSFHSLVRALSDSTGKSTSIGGKARTGRDSIGVDSEMSGDSSSKQQVQNGMVPAIIDTLEASREAVRLLADPEFDKPLLEHHREREYVSSRSFKHPRYEHSTNALPQITELYFEELRCDIMRLLGGRKSRNFTQWIMQYCRQQWPDIFGFDALSAKASVNLRSWLADRETTPLHVAAAFGLAKVCQALIGLGQDVNQISSIGSPLYCALIGPQTFALQTKDPTWQIVRSSPEAIDQAMTISILLDAGADAAEKITSFGEANKASLATIAFISCAKLENVPLFQRIIDEGAELDSYFNRLFDSSSFWSSSDLNRGRPAGSTAFLNETFSWLMDLILPNVHDSEGLEALFHAIWDQIKDLNLECGSPQSKRRVETIPDTDFSAFVPKAIRLSNSNVIRRLIQDPRWDPNAQTENNTVVIIRSHEGSRERRRSSSSSSTSSSAASALGPSESWSILHCAVESTSLEIVKYILASKPDLNARDHQGRTPLMLAESTEILAAMIQAGGSTTDTDNAGRNIWHYVAANNDQEILKWLIANDKNKDENLRAVSKSGRTPLAEALVYSLEMSTTRMRSTSLSVQARLTKGSVLLLIDQCKGDQRFCISNRALVHAAAEWGIEELVAGIIEAGADPLAISENGSTSLHNINFSATESLVKCLQAHCAGLPIQRKDGLTPAETIFLNFRTLGATQVDLSPNYSNSRGRRFFILTSHPSCSKPLSKDVYNLLLTPEVLDWKDESGRCIWERFCTNIIAEWASMNTSEAHSLTDLIADSVGCAVDALIQHGALAKYENEKTASGLLLILEKLIKDAREVKIPNWLDEIFLKVLEATSQLELFKESPHAVLSLRWAIRGARTTLLYKLLDKGLSVHQTLEGMSTLEVVCLANNGCSPGIFRKLLQHADTSKLNDVDEQGQGLIHMLTDHRVSHRDEKLRILLEAGADPNLRRWGASPAIISYIMERQIDAAVILLDHGADPSLATKDGLDSALAAASRGSIRLLEKIRSCAGSNFDWRATCTSRFTIVHPGGHGVSLTARNCNALHLAAFNGHDLVLQFYISSFKLDLEAETHDELWRPLHFAALGGSSTCIRLLHEKGANLDSRVRDGGSALHVAVRWCQPPAIRTLLELGPKNPVDGDQATPFLHALRVGIKDVIEPFNGQLSNTNMEEQPAGSSAKRFRLIGGAMEVMINQNDIHGCKSILMAATTKDLDRAVLKCGGCNLPMLAVRKHKAEILQWLLEIGVSGFLGRCALHYHLSSGFNLINEIFDRFAVHTTPAMLSTILKLVLNAYLDKGIPWLGAPIITPIHVAAKRGLIEPLTVIVKHLKENAHRYKYVVFRAKFSYPSMLTSYNRKLLDPAGPTDTTLPDIEVTQIVAAALNQPVPFLESLPDIYEPGWTALHIAIDNHSDGILGYLIENGANIEAHDKLFNTPLHIAAREGNLRGAKSLLANKANPNCRNSVFNTPIMRAAERGQFAIAKILVEHGADINDCASDGMSLLNMCGEQSKNPALFTFLLDLGLDPYREDKSGYMPLHDILLNGDFVGYVLNSGLDFSRVTDINKGIFSMIIEMNPRSANLILRRFLKRMPPQTTKRLINVYPQRFVSALCNAVVRDELDCIPTLLQYGADINAEGSEVGSALMVACMKGRLNAVRVLLRYGARVAYYAKVDNKIVLRNGLQYARKFPSLVKWLLVDRYTEQLLLPDPEDVDDDENLEFKCWSGIVPAYYQLSVFGLPAGRAYGNSWLDYLSCLSQLRHSLREHAITVHPNLYLSPER
jgi:ankyrin repeat protein